MTKFEEMCGDAYLAWLEEPCGWRRDCVKIERIATHRSPQRHKDKEVKHQYTSYRNSIVESDWKARVLCGQR